MGVFNYLKRIIKSNDNSTYSAWLTDSQPIFTSIGQNIYLSDFVNNAIDRVASEISKIEIKSIVKRDGFISVQNDDITRLFRYKPNPLQTTSDFLANVEWLRRKDRNVFIYPQYEKIITPSGREFKRYTAFYPLKPQMIYIGVSPSGNAWEIKLCFEDGTSYTMPYENLIHLRWRRGTNTIIGGGDDNGLANDNDVLRTISALDKTIQGLPKSIEASLQVKGVYQVKSLMDLSRRNAERDEFENHITSGKSGIIAVDYGGDFTPVKIDPPQIPRDTLDFLKSVILNRYGISPAILEGDYNGEQHSAFYQTAIEDFIIQFEQAMTSTLFTPREQDVGRQIKCYYSKVNYLATADKMNLANLAKETGLMTLNEINEMFGISPFEGGDRRLQSLNYVNINDVDEYQKGRANIG